jgi:His/Glu/Gln/Arg/opine family amino acid ABC transporter permease subunit
MALEISWRVFQKVFIEGGAYRTFLNGLLVTLQLALGAVIVGVLLGLTLAFMRLSNWRVLGVKPLSMLSGAYIDLIRGTPMVMQLLIFSFVIFGGIRSTNPMVKLGIGALAFGCNSGAYVAEIIRAGILSVEHGQTEAGRSLGLTQWQTMRHIVLPQAAKNVIPALGNELIVLIKETSIFGYIGGVDLAKVGEQVRARTFFSLVPLLTVALMYYVVVKLLTMLLQIVERRLRAGDHR